MKYLLFAGLIFTFLSCNGQSSSSNETVTKDVTVVNYDGLKKVLEQEKENKLLIVNFWATWCVPCVEELPEFMEVNDKYKNNPNYKMILISMDRVKSLDSVKHFLEKKSVTTDVYLLDDIKTMNTWIPDMESTWSGAIPATLIYKNGTKIFFKEEQLNKGELETLIKSNL